MKGRHSTTAIAAALGGALLLLWTARVARAGAPGVAIIAIGSTLYEDPDTGALYRKPGKGRVAVIFGAPPAASTAPVAPGTGAAIEQRVEQRTQQQIEQVQEQNQQNTEALRAEFLQKQEKLTLENAELAERVKTIEPAWRQYIDSFQNKMRVGALLYADWNLYTHTGWGPQPADNLTPPGPGNNLYSSFDITRAYLQFFFYPTEDLLLRITPDIYKTAGKATPDSFGKSSAINSNLSGDLNYRLKYAYVLYGKAFNWSPELKGDTISFGLIQQPFLPWEEDLYGYRFANTTPWNFLGLSTSYFGISMQGPIKFNELQYVDYDFGAYTNAKYSQFEQGNTKQVMGRVSVYPFGARWRFDGLGATFAYDYGYGNVAPDTTAATGFGSATTAFGSAAKAHVMRLAALLHYTTPRWQIAVEYDSGHNAFTGSNFFSGAGPAEFFTPTTTPAQYGVPYHNFSALVAALQNNSRTVQAGWDVFGHYKFPHTPLTAFGMFQWFQPNTKVNENPLDFQRWIAGLSYQYNEYLRIALDSQNLLFYHSQFPFTTKYANTFAPVFVKIPNPGHIPPVVSPPATVNQPVPRDTHAIFLNLEFNY
ncbi:MAG TPA: hypothetical protein VIX59_04815 [Candidatus Binataceae bacterium]